MLVIERKLACPIKDGAEAMPAALSGLLAIAIVRKLMLELNAPDADIARYLGHEVAVWVNRSSEDLGGRTPAEVLASPHGEAAVKDWLQRQLQPRHPSER